MTGEILTFDDHTAPRELSCDVCIVGSGAGGSVLAAELTARGLSVVLLEAGGYHTRRDFDLDERKAYHAMYQDNGGRASADLGVTVLQGRGVGGGTTINWTTCFRTPERILAHWASEHGVDTLAPEVLAPHFEAVEERLNIGEWPREIANANNQVLFRGCEALGWEVAPLRRNVRGCANSGFCGVGCPVDGKQAMHVTYLPDALSRGLTLLANVHVERFELEGGRVVAVRGRAMAPGAPLAEGPEVVVRPKIAVSSGGAINSPMLLLRSGLGDLGPVGRRTFLHPVVGLGARYAERVEPFYGAPQSASSHQFVERGPGKVGFFLEAPPLQPMLAAVSLGGFGVGLQERLALLPHLGLLIALSVDGLLPGDDGGTVSLRSDGRLHLDYPVRPFLAEAFHEAHKAMARVALAAGAEEVFTTHGTPVVLRSEADLPLLDGAAYGLHEHRIFTAHQMGGCGMGADPARSVVDPHLRHHHVPNLFVVDGSVFPTALGVNPSQTIYGLARWASEHIAQAV